MSIHVSVILHLFCQFIGEILQFAFTITVLLVVKLELDAISDNWRSMQIKNKDPHHHSPPNCFFRTASSNLTDVVVLYIYVKMCKVASKVELP